MKSLRYFVLKYEDLVAKPTESLERLYEQFEVDIDRHAVRSLQDHLEREATLTVNGERRNNYMTTYKGPNFKHDIWRIKLKPAEVTEVEQACKKFMQRFDYH